MGGAGTIAAVVRFSRTLTNNQRISLGLPRYRKGGDYRKTPSYSAFYNLLKTLDPDAFAASLSEWLKHPGGTLPRHLALDGKFISDIVGVVSLVDVATGVPVAVTIASQKAGEGHKRELMSGRGLLARQDISNATVSLDALHTREMTADEIAMSGGEFIMRIKGNRKKILADAKTMASGHTPFFIKTRTKGMAASKPASRTSTN